jgi:CMP/dCMP kinase
MTEPRSQHGHKLLSTNTLHHDLVLKNLFTTTQRCEYTVEVTSDINQPSIQLSANSVITIDGLAASGKSSAAQGIARRLGIPYVSSGLLYRAVTFAALQSNTDITDEDGLLVMLKGSNLKLEPQNDGNRAILNGRDISAQCHSSGVDTNVSLVAHHDNVRAWVNKSIRALDKPFVAEGRDMGAVVFKDAEVKLFLTASSDNRAKRRTLERPEDFERIKHLIQVRDAADTINSSAAPDAVIIDTEHLNLEEVIAVALDAIRTALSS